MPVGPAGAPQTDVSPGLGPLRCRGRHVVLETSLLALGYGTEVPDSGHGPNCPRVLNYYSIMKASVGMDTPEQEGSHSWAVIKGAVRVYGCGRSCQLNPKNSPWKESVICQYGTSRKQTEWQAQAAGTQLLGVQGRQIVFTRNLYSWPWVAECQTQIPGSKDLPPTQRLHVKLCPAPQHAQGHTCPPVRDTPWYFQNCFVEFEGQVLR